MPKNPAEGGTKQRRMAAKLGKHAQLWELAEVGPLYRLITIDPELELQQLQRLVPGLFYVLFGVRTQRFYPQMTSSFTSTYSKDVLRNRPGTRPYTLYHKP